jgi:hypothetical protein
MDPEEAPDAGPVLTDSGAPGDGGGGVAADAMVADVDAVIESGLPEADASQPGCGSSCDRLVFVTSRTFPGDFGGGTPYDAADALCNDSSNALDSKVKGHNFRAWLSLANAAAAAHFPGARGRYIRSDSTAAAPVVVAETWAALISNKLLNGLGADETGAQVSGLFVWTGTNADGTASSAVCGNWATSDPPTNQTGLVGVATPSVGSPPEQWTDDKTVQSCSGVARLYCIEY